MEAEGLLQRLEERGVKLQLEGDALRVSAPKGVLDENLRNELVASKPQLIALLRAGARNNSVKADRNQPLPVSAAQQRLWFLDRVEPGNPAYNMAGASRMRGPLDVEAFTAAAYDLGQRHESLRTRIGERNGAPWVEIADTQNGVIDFIDLSDKPAAEAEASVQQIARDVANTAFDMAGGFLSKLVLVRISPTEHVLVSSVHHIIGDGWSLGLLMSEIFAVYEARLAGRPSPLAPLTYTPVDYAAWEQQQVSQRKFDDSIAFWKRELGDAPALIDLPTDRPRAAKASMHGGRLVRFIDPALIARVKSRAQQQGATLFMALMACWQAVLHRYSGQDDILVGTPLANRDRPEFESLMACLINNVVIRGRLQDNPTLSAFLDQMKAQSLSAFQHGQAPFDLVVEAVNPPRSSAHAPVFQVLLTHMQFPIAQPRLNDLSMDAFALDVVTARFDLLCEMSTDAFGEHAGKQRLNYEFSLDLFDEASIARLHEHFELMLTAFVEDASRRISDIPLSLSAADLVKLREWSSASAEHDRARCVHHLLETSVAADPDAVALVSGGETLTFGELDRRANKLARLLQANGVKPRDLVAFCVDRSADMPETMAAILKAGAAYVPLDPTHPSDRLRYIVQNSGAACVVTLRRFAGLFDGAGVRLIVLDEAADALGALSDASPDVAVDPSDLAYVIYTSGSTGQPKGVEVEHRNVVAFLDAMAREPGFTGQDVLLAVTTPAFDISGLEIWLPLMKGGRIVMAQRTDVVDGARLAQMIDDNGVTMLQATPATWRMLIDAGWSGKPGLKALCGGEAMPRDLAAQLVSRVAELWNMYGPTETTIWSTVSRIEDASAGIAIGRPIANTRVYVVDANGRQAPIGVVGELCIGGEGVARGYRNLPELTAEKFIDIDPLGAGAERLYRTGDLARFKSDGQLVYIGRRDHQVKVRGYRIELGEIEATLAAQPGVKECTVIVREDAPGDQRLVAYVVSPRDAQFDAETAKTGLRQRLPEYMTPSAFVVLDTFPLTPNGKIDRKALPAPTAPVVGAAMDQAAALMSPTQRRVADIWKELLRVDAVRLTDSFFDLGGHSLLLVKLHARLKAELGVDMPLVELFQRTTIAAQADMIASPERGRDAVERARSRAERLTRG